MIQPADDDLLNPVCFSATRLFGEMEIEILATAVSFCILSVFLLLALETTDPLVVHKYDIKSRTGKQFFIGSFGCDDKILGAKRLLPCPPFLLLDVECWGEKEGRKTIQ